MSYRRLCLCLLLFALTGCGRSAEEPARLYAAASTREAIERIVGDFRTSTGIPVETNIGPSSGLALQIEQGGPADLFLSADEPWADYLQKAGLVAERRNLLTNRLVVVIPQSSTLALRRLDDLAAAEVKRLALAGATVPAGRYATEALAAAGVWEKVQPRVLRGKDVRAALLYVEKGEADAGIVYATDAAAAAGVRVALEVPPPLHSPVVYPLVLVNRRPVRPAARRLYDHLSSPAAAAAFRRAGFGMAE
jgi:molybdate transport system substrate-binding protein